MITAKSSRLGSCTIDDDMKVTGDASAVEIATVIIQRAELLTFSQELTQQRLVKELRKAFTRVSTDYEPEDLLEDVAY